MLLWTLSLALAILVVVVSVPKAQYAFAASGDLTGAAWSSNIGWIGMGNDGGSYGVKVATTGTTRNLSGYAWSSNIGWISFDNAATTGCPVGPCQARVEWGAAGGPSVQVKGWARACSVFASDCSGSLKTGGVSGSILGGWDGFISLGDSNTSDGVSYGVRLNTSTGKTGGYAWGSEVVGWVDFSGVKISLEETPLCPDGTAVPSDGICPSTPNDNTNCPIGSACYCASHSTDTQNCHSGNTTCPNGASQLPDGSCPALTSICTNISQDTLDAQGIGSVAQLGSGHYVQQADGRCTCQPGYILNAQLRCVKPIYQEQ